MEKIMSNIEKTNQNSNETDNVVIGAIIADDLHNGAMTEDDLNAIELNTNIQRESGLISEKQQAETQTEIVKARKRFNDLTDQQRKKLIGRRVASGQNMMVSTLTGSTAVVLDVVLSHGILKNLFLQFVPYFDRAMVNMSIFGEEVFSKQNNNDRMTALAKLASDFYEQAQNARMSAETLKDEARSKFDNEGISYYTPSVPTPAIKCTVHIHNRNSMKFLQGFVELDKLLLVSSWLEWNECRTPQELSKVTRPLINNAITTGRRGYSTFTDLMIGKSKLEMKPDENPPLAA